MPGDIWVKITPQYFAASCFHLRLKLTAAVANIIFGWRIAVWLTNSFDLMLSAAGKIVFKAKSTKNKTKLVL